MNLSHIRYLVAQLPTSYSLFIQYAIPVLVLKRDIGRMVDNMEEGEISYITETTTLESIKKTIGMVKVHCTTRMETRYMKEGGRIANITDREHTMTDGLETSIQANGMTIGKDTEKLTTQTELSIQEAGIGFKMII